jgi:Flp pilus assembly protein TadG
MRAPLFRCRDGVGAVEFALILPVLVVLLLAGADLGLAVNEKMRLTSAARAGAQSAYQKSGDTGGVTLAARQAAGSSADGLAVVAQSFCACASGAAAACSETCPDGTGTRSYVSVSVSRVWSPVLAYPGLGQGLTLSGSMTVRVR